jgi:hypothetical protein
LEAGTARCRACAQGRGLQVREHGAVVLESMMKLSPEQFVVQPLVAEAGMDLERLSQRLLNLHLEKQLKSYGLLKEALQSQ